MLRLRITLLTILVVAGCATKKNQEMGSWSESMQNLAENLNQLLPYMYDDEAYSNPINRKKLQKNLRAFEQNSGEIPKHMASAISGNDPLFEVGLNGLERSARKASESFDLEQFKYSQHMLQNSIGHCFRCHVRSSQGREVVKWEHFNLPQTKIPPVALAKLFVSTRQFTKAKVTLQKYINRSDTKIGQALKKERALKILLTIVLRYEVNPKKAKTILQGIPKRTFSAMFEKDLKPWVKSLARWVKEDKQTLTLSTLKQRAFKDHLNKDASFIDQIRLSYFLHSALPSTTVSSKKSEFYLDLGKIYNLNPEIGLFELAELYYEACIKASPHSKIALKCYSELEQEITLGFTGTMGTLIPAKERSFLREMKALTKMK